MIAQKKVILLTGATGYLGSNILPRLIEGGYEVKVLKRSFSNTFRIDAYLDRITTYNVDKIDDCRQLFEENKIDTILHCATHYGRKDNGAIHVLEANLLLPLRLLELGREYGVRHFISTDTILDKRINSYSLSKKQFKEWLMSYKNDLVCINMALEHFYGAGDDDTKFVSYILRSLLRGVDSIDITKGEQKRDFVYIDDVVSAFMTVLNSIDKSNVENGFYSFEIGSGKAITIRELVEMMKKSVHNEKTILNFGALPYRENEVMECVADTSQMEKMGWKCKYSLEEGIAMTIQAELKI